MKNRFDDITSLARTPGLGCRVSRRARQRRMAAVLVAAAAAQALLPTSTRAATETWTGTTDSNWNTSGNWTGGNATPQTGDTITFGTAGNGRLTSNNDIVGLSLGGLSFLTGAGNYNLTGNNITLTGPLVANAAGNTQTFNFGVAGTAALQMGTDNSGGNNLAFNASSSFGSMTVSTNSATADSIAIASGATLSMNSTFTLGVAPPNPGSANTVTQLNLTGAGTWSVVSTTNTNFAVGVGAGSNTPTGQPQATLDMTGLSNFVFSTGTGYFGVGHLVTRPTSNVRLANTSNSITAALISIGDSNQAGGNNNGGGSNLFLGAGTNVLAANSFVIGNTKSAGSLQFNGGAGSVVITGEAGGASTATIQIGRASSATGTGTTSQLLLAGHNATVQASTVTVGLLAGATGGTDAGLVTFDTGTFNVANLVLASQTSGSAGNGSAGTFTLGGASPNTTATGVLNVTTEFSLAKKGGTSTGGNSVGIFTINGGTANTSVDILDASTITGHTATINLNAGTLNMNGKAIGNSTNPVTMRMPGFNAGSTLATLSNLGGAGINAAGLTMDGTGTLVLGGTNTYTGNTTISSGTLAVNGTLSASSNVNVNSGGSLAGAGNGTSGGLVSGSVTMAGGSSIHPGGTGADGSVGTLTLSSLNVNGGDLRFDLTSGGSDLLNVTGAATFNAGATVSVSPVGLANGTFTILTSSALSNASTNLTLASASVGRSNLSLDFATLNTVKLTVSGSAANLTWVGANNAGAWDIQTTQNWNSTATSGNPFQYYEADNVIFDETSANRTVALNTTVSPGSVSFTHTTGNYTFTGSGAIAGGTGLSVSGGAIVNMPLANTYTGATTISGGSTLVVSTLADGGAASGTGAAVGSSGLVLNNGILQWTGAASQSSNRGFTLGTGGGTIEALPTSGGAVLTLSGAIAFTGSGARTLTLGGTDPTPLTPGANVLSAALGDGTGGATSLVKTGASNWQLNTASNYSGGTTVSAGRLRANAGGTLGSGAVSVANNAGLFISTNSNFSNAFTIAGLGYTEQPAGESLNNFGAIRLGTNGATISGTVTLAADARITARGATGSGGVITGRITGNQALELGNGNTVGVLTLSNTTNNWTGNTTISLGTLKAGAGSGATSGVIPHGAGAGNVIVSGDTVNTGNSTLDVNGFNLIVNGLTATGNLAQAVVTNNSTTAGTITVGDNNASSAFTGTFAAGTATGAAALSVAKTGSGTLTLSTSHSYIGNTNVNQGNLTLLSSGSIAASTTINVASGATFDVSDFNAGGGFNVPGGQTLVASGTVLGQPVVSGTLSGASTGNAGAVTLNGGSHVNPGASANDGSIGTLNASSLSVNGTDFRLDLTGAGDSVAVSGAATFNAGATVSVVPGAAPATYTILTAGTLTNASTNLSLSQTSLNRVNYALDFATANTVKLIVTGGPASLIWNNSAPATGDGSSWDTQSNQNWLNGAAPDLFFSGDTVTFNDNNNTHYAVSIGSNVAPAAVVVSNNSNTYIFSGGGSITGTASLTKNGTGALTIANANTYTGGTVLNTGTLNLANAAALSTGLVTFNGGTIDNTSGGELTLSNNPQSWAGSFTFTGANSMSMGNGAVTLNAAPTVTVSANTLTVAGAISNGSGNGFTKAGPGTLALTGSSSYTGNTNITDGVLKTSTNGSLGPLTGGGQVNVSGTGTLDIGGNTTANNVNFGAKQFNIAGAGFGGNGAIINSASAAQNNAFQQVKLTANASIGGTGRFDIRGGTPVLDLAGNTLTKLGANQFSLVGVNVTDGNIIVNSGIFSMETTTAVAANGSDSTSITYNTGATALFFSNTTAVSTITRRMIINGTGVVMGTGSNGNTSVIGSPITLNEDLTISPQNGGAATGNLNLTGAISDGAASHGITKTGANALLLGGLNTYTGPTNINAGSFTLSTGATLASATVTVDSGATATFNGVNGAAATVNANGTTTFAGTTGGTALNRPLAALNIGSGVAAAITASTFPYTPSFLHPTNTTFADGSSKIDITNNALTTTGTLASIVPLITTTGQIFSSSTGGALGTLQIGPEVEVRYTLLGDTNLDGKVDVTDLGNLAGNYGATSGATWVQGDTNYSGTVDVTDLGNLAGNYGGQLATSPSAGEGGDLIATSLASVASGGGAAVPEPAAIGLLGISAIGLLSRRMRKTGK